MSSLSLSLSLSLSAQMRPNVVIKTHAATGQRTTAGNVISAVWEKCPVHGVAQPESSLNQVEEVDSDSNKQMSGVKVSVLLVYHA